MTDAPTIQNWLKRQFPSARMTTLRRMVSDGRIHLGNRQVRSLKEVIPAGLTPQLAATAPALPVLPDAMQAVYADGDILVLIKPPGLLTATHRDETRPTVLAGVNRAVQKNNQKRQVQLIHRLDRDASGLLVLAGGIHALAHLKRQFRTHSVVREYELIVHGRPHPADGRLEHVLFETATGHVRVLDEKDRRRRIAGKRAILNYQTLTFDGQYSLLRCRLHTGRKHQIRVQFSALGHPLVGDPVYGTPAARQGKEGRLCLHAVHIRLTHPRTGQALDFNSPLPVNILKLIRT